LQQFYRLKGPLGRYLYYLICPCEAEAVIIKIKNSIAIFYFDYELSKKSKDFLDN
jgi:hypothetical protein